MAGKHGVDELVAGEKRDGKLYFAASIRNGFVPATRRLPLNRLRLLVLDRLQVTFAQLGQRKSRLRPIRLANLSFEDCQLPARQGRIGRPEGTPDLLALMLDPGIIDVVRIPIQGFADGTEMSTRIHEFSGITISPRSAASRNR